MSSFISHDIHIPVMGIGFSIDTPVKVSRYGIHSVISLASDHIIELMRKYYSELRGLPYNEIRVNDTDSRARRITSYLNIIDDIVNEQIDNLKKLSLKEEYNDLHKTFQMLAPGHHIRQLYEKYLVFKKSAQERFSGSNEQVLETTLNEDATLDLENTLKSSLTKGRIDVNIMTKLDYPFNRGSEKYLNESMSGLRGFALSNLHSGMVFSAGINTALYTYLASFPEFLPGDDGVPNKEVILKISDYRSMAVQSRFLANKGIWVSEYRIESGLNCGGHAFGNPEGKLAGPIVDEIMVNKAALYKDLLDIYTKTLHARGINISTAPAPARITYQGGVKTYEEKKWFLDRGIQSVGIGTPFLFVPEVTNVAENTLQLLMAAEQENIVLSNASPLGIPFWMLNNTTGDITHKERALSNKPGVVCTYGHLRMPKDGTEKLICDADSRRIVDKLKAIVQMPEGLEKDHAMKQTLEKQCLCTGLVGDVKKKYELKGERFRHTADEVVCAGPSAAYFNNVYSLKDMMQHFIGEKPLLDNADVPNTHTEELRINIARLEEVLSNYNLEKNSKNSLKDSQTIATGLQNSINWYRERIDSFNPEIRPVILRDLDFYEKKLQSIKIL